MSKFSFKEITDSFKTRSFRAGGYSIAATAIVLAIVILINLMVGALPAKMTKFDITENQLYSISEQTQAVVREVTKDITIYWILTDGEEDGYLKSLLELVQEHSNRIKVVVKDTSVYPNFAANYTAETPYPNSLIVECGEKYRYLDFTSDIYTYDYADYYTTGTYTQYFNGEGALVSAIDYVTSEVLPKLYILTGHGETALTTAFSTAVKNQNVETAELSLLTVEAVPADADGILINAPTKDISAAELETLRTYMAAGGNVMLISDLYTGESKLTNLEALMAEYGMSSVPGIVVETDRGRYYSMQQQAVQHALLPMMNSHAITDPLINGNYYVMFIGAHGIQTLENAADDVTVTELLSTSTGAFSKLDGENFQNYNKADKDIDGPFALAALATKNEDQENESNVIWVGSSTLVDESTDNYVSGGNMDLFLNMLSYLCDPDAAELTIHAKPISSTKYLTMTGSTTTVLAVIVLILIPLGYLAWGVVIWFRRKRQ